MSKTWTAKCDLLAIPDINQGQGKVSVGRQGKIFPWCQLVHTNQKEEVLLQEWKKITSFSLLFLSKAQLIYINQNVNFPRNQSHWQTIK